jgi:CheY-like chemotaxis protein
MGQESRPRLLLVEDHDDTRRTMERLLRRRGYDLTVADSVRAALHAIEHATFDILISDIGLPDGTGNEVMEAVRVQQPSVIGIALSGFGMPDDIKRSSASGFAHHLTKPVELAQLEAKLREVAHPEQGASGPG